MGLKDTFRRVQNGRSNRTTPSPTAESSIGEKDQTSIEISEAAQESTGNGSSGGSRASFSRRSISQASPSGASMSRVSMAMSTYSSFVDDIRHEAMCNYLYQQQCSKLWVSDGSGELEGVLVRKGRHEYTSYPPALVDSPFAAACSAMNVHVRLLSIPFSSSHANRA